MAKSSTEVAHVMQQRGGVQLVGGIGKVGDSYEQHADAVADRVTAGQSAEALLDRFAGRQDETAGTLHLSARKAFSPLPLSTAAPDPTPAGQVQRVGSKVPLQSGTFEAEYYEALQTKKPTHKIGAAIVMTFTPNLPVPGRVGLVQTIEHDASAMHVDTPVLYNVLDEQEKNVPEEQKKNVPDEQKKKVPGEQQKWKLAVVSDSPVYAALRDLDQPLKAAPKSLADTADPKETLSKVKTPAHKSVSEEKVKESGAYKNPGGETNPPVPTSKYQTGESFGSGEKKPVPAALTDTPGFAANSEAATSKWTWKAEVAAIMLSGPQQGQHLGSVRWGWQYTPRERSDWRLIRWWHMTHPKSAELNPKQIEQVSAADPSDKFMKAAFDWNTQSKVDPQTGSKVDLIQLPLSSEVMNELAKARAQEWAKLDVNKLWKRTEELLATHEKSASKMLSPSERTLLEVLGGMFHERAIQLDKSIKQQRETIKEAEEEGMSSYQAKELLVQYTERENKEASFLPRIEKLLKDYQPSHKPE